MRGSIRYMYAVRPLCIRCASAFRPLFVSASRPLLICFPSAFRPLGGSRSSVLLGIGVMELSVAWEVDLDVNVAREGSPGARHC